MGTMLGAQVINYWRSPYLMLYFSLFLVFVAINQVRPKIAVTRALPAKPWHYLASFIQGFIRLSGCRRRHHSGAHFIGHGFIHSPGYRHQCSAGFVYFIIYQRHHAHQQPCASIGAAGQRGVNFLPALFVVTPISSLMAPLG